MSQDDWIRVLLSIGIGFVFIGLMGRRRQPTTSENRRPARLAMIAFIIFGSIGVGVLAFMRL